MLVIGDIILDQYIYGVTYLSPDFPSFLVQMHESEYFLGGAANVANNLEALGEEVELCGVVGNDPSGSIISKLLEEKNIKQSLLIENVNTSLKTRFLDIEKRAHLLRCDNVGNRVFPDEIIEKLKGYIKRHKIVLISNYNEGTISSEIFKEAKVCEAVVLVDSVHQNIKDLEEVDFLFPNLKEFERLVISLEISPSDSSVLVENLDQLAIEVRKRLKIKNLILKLGKWGVLWAYDEKTERIFGKEISVKDTTGAGDTFMAAFARFYKGDVYKALEKANIASAIAISKYGISTVTEREILGQL